MPFARFRRHRQQPALPASLAACALFGLWAGMPAMAQDSASSVRRCTAADGSTVFTDRACADIGATERLPANRGTAAAHAGSLRRPGCARSVQDLVFEMTFAIDAGDVNRLAGVYHWVGMSSGGGIATMNRLQAIVQRPLVDIAPVFPAPPASEDVTLSSFEQALDAAYRSASRPRRPTALRVEQTLGNTSTPSRTVFGLRRHMDCWWVTL
ncbi:MAG: hypothetical protein Q4F49_03530 [Pseudoxanthomonas suwonensis]|nr:hypothetical protein [Pseudoxanthomonas suwonensis]